jgi:MoxR-like ATPase
MSGAQLQNQEKLQQVLYEIKKVIVGQDHLLERVVIALLAQGHLLVEGVPGLAKTLTIKTLAQALQCRFRRVQFTPDLLPADLVGTRIFNQKTGEFTTWLGPVFTNLLLADEINRSPAKVQSALLEVMQERQVSIGGETFKVEEPFLVMATQNPIETEGTYPLPEAQVDRFMMKVVIDYPNEMEEFVIVERMTGKLEQVQPVLTVQELLELRKEAEQVFTDPALMEYAVKLTVATRDPEKFGLSELKPYITYGASPRSSINLVLAARALAYLRGRSWVLPQDMVDVALDVMRHRLVLSYEALAEGVTSDTILKRILETVPSPREVLKSHAEATYKS